LDSSQYAALVGTPPGVLYGLFARYAAAASEAAYEHAWQRDRALLEAVDRGLAEAAGGTVGPGAAGEGTAPKPRWLDGLVARELRQASTTFWSRGGFVRVRLLERLGLVELDPDDTYVLAMVSSLGPGKAEALRSDPDLVDRALWRVFEVEGSGEVSLTNVDRFGGDEWRTAFLELGADGTLERSRLLSACLAALGRDFAAYRAGWYSATYLALKPTDDEVVASQEGLRRLLGAAVPATVSFAVKGLVRVQRAGRLDAVETLELLPAATLVKAKGTALDALRLARACATEHPVAVATVAHAALGHPHADVQRAAATLLADCGRGDVVSAAADDLTPSVRHELGLDVDAVGPAATGGTAATGTPMGARPVQRLAGRAAPVAASDLAERVAALLEDASDAAELEAVMAALVAPDVGESLVPLRKRAKAVVVRGPRTDLGDSWLPGQVARVVLRLVGEPAPAAAPSLPAQRFVVQRLGELRESAGPLLATPDLPGGWVSAAALVDGLAQQATAPRHHDLVAALLRLHPDGREAAVAGGVDLPAAVRFALDGAEPARRLLRTGRAGPQAWWRAAERSRAAYPPDVAPRLSGDVRTHTWTEHGRERTSRYARFAVTTSTARQPADDQPTELVAATADQWGSGGVSRHLGDWIPALAAIWPHDAEHFLALTCVPVLESPSWTETAHDVPRTLDALAQHPGRLGSLAAATLAAGLSATQRVHRLHAVDAFLDLAASGRIPLPEVATALARYAPAWPANRWAESLTSAAQAPGGADATVGLLTHLLPQLPSDHRGLNQLLDLLRDQLLRLDQHATDPALRQWLGSVSGSSSAARTARLLLG
jgi:hypothetical protein